MSTSAETVQRSFDPSRYLTRLPRRLRDGAGAWTTTEAEYLEVKWRLLWLRTDHPEAAIETELVSHQEGMAVFRARVTIPAGGSATGWGHETAAGFEDYLEKAETKALGRALAALGYGTQFCEDFDFEDARATQRGRSDRLRIVDAPVHAPPHGDGPSAPTAPANADEGAGSVAPAAFGGAEDNDSDGVSRPSGRSLPPLTEPQLKAIYAIGRGSLGLEQEAIERRSRERYGSLPQALNRRQASAFIDALKREAGNGVD
ncbi:MAG TPA: hypothetical protein VK821_21030 [Dehalococcoidia bacterium]|nr:hypothetical protein [Dehalococcoidia bacterium]